MLWAASFGFDLFGFKSRRRSGLVCLLVFWFEQGINQQTIFSCFRNSTEFTLHLFFLLFPNDVVSSQLRIDLFGFKSRTRKCSVCLLAFLISTSYRVSASKLNHLFYSILARQTTIFFVENRQNLLCISFFSFSKWGCELPASDSTCLASLVEEDRVWFTCWCFGLNKVLPANKTVFSCFSKFDRKLASHLFFFFFKPINLFSPRHLLQNYTHCWLVLDWTFLASLVEQESVF